MDHQFPPPTNEIEFERFCSDLLKMYWPDSNPQKWGRKGQKQRGVDIVDMNAHAPLRGAQCKFHKVGVLLTAKELQEEVEEARKFNLNGIKLGRYTVITTSENDTGVQGTVIQINHHHRAEGQFLVELLTWEMIEEILRENPGLWERAIGKSLKGLVEPLNSGLSGLAATVNSRFEAIEGTVLLGSIDTKLNTVKDYLNTHRRQEAELLASSLRSNEWGKMTGEQRFRTLSYLATVDAQKGKYLHAGHLFIEAAQHYPEDERAKYNHAAGLEMLGKREEAHTAARHITKEYPASLRAWALLCRTAPEEILTVTLDAEIPLSAKNNDEILVALAYRAWKESKWSLVVKYCESAISTESHWAAPWTLLGQAKLRQAIDLAYKPMSGAVVFGSGNVLPEVIRCFDRAIVEAQKTGVALDLAQALILRARSHLLNHDPSKAEEDLTEAYRTHSSDPEVLAQYGQFLAGYRTPELAIPILRNAVEQGVNGDAAYLLAAALHHKGREEDFHECIKLAKLASVSDESKFRCSAIDFVLNGLINNKELGEASEFVDSLPVSGINCIVIESARARIARAQGSHELSLKHADNAHANVNDDTPVEVRRFLAETLNLIGDHSRAFPEWEIVAASSKLLPDTWELVSVASRLGRHDVIRNACKAWREAGIHDPRLVEEELAYLEFYEPQTAVDRIQDLIQRDPDEKYYVLRLSLLGVRLSRNELICTDVSRFPSVDELSPDDGHKMVQVLIDGGNALEAVKYSYELMRRHPSVPGANLAFAWAMLRTERMLQPGTFAPSTTVGEESAFCFEELGSDTKLWRVVEVNDAGSAFDDELAPDHQLVQQLSQTSTGEEFVIDGDEFDGRKAVLECILSKYVYRLNKVMNEWQIRFPGEPGFQSVRVEGIKDGKNSIPDFTPLIRRIHQRQHHVDRQLESYRDSPMPIHILSQRTGTSDMATLEYLARDEESIVKCCPPNHDAYGQAMNAARIASHCVLDITALTTLRLLSVEAAFVLWPRQFEVSTHTLLAFEERVERSFQSTEGGVAIATDGGLGFQYLKRPADEFASERERAHAFLEQIRSAVTVCDCAGLASLPSEKRDMLIKLFGHHGAEAIVLSTIPGRVLWSDDFALVLVAQGEFGVRRIWTQAALHVAMLDGALTEAEWGAASAKLLGFNYDSTRFTPGVLKEACRLAQWDTSAFPLKQALETLSSDTNPQANIQIAYKLLVNIFSEIILHAKHEEVAIVILDAIARGPFGIDSVRTLRRLLPDLFRFRISDERALRDVIDRWLSVRGEA